MWTNTSTPANKGKIPGCCPRDLVLGKTIFGPKPLEQLLVRDAFFLAELAPILQVLGDQMGTFEAVGATGFAQPAVEAGLHFGQFRSPILVHVLLPRGSAAAEEARQMVFSLNPWG